MRAALLAASAALALAGCSSAAPDPRGVDRDETLLTLTASGEAETVPDEATLQIGVESFGASAQAASASTAKKGEAIASALAKYGVAEKDLQTSNLSIGRVDYGPRKGQFQASNVLNVRLKDVPRAGEAVAAATDAGANVMSGPMLRIADPEKANRGAYIAAFAAARTRAEAYAEAAGMKIARVLVIRDGGQGGGGPIPYAYAEQAMDAAASSGPPPIVAPPPPQAIRPGTSRTRVSVAVDFALERK